MPLNIVRKQDLEYDAYLNGKNLNFFRFLHRSALELPGNSHGYGEYGNKVIIGHSSYWKDHKVRYKTHFQRIIEMDPGEEIWIYQRSSEDGPYTRYVYRVTESYNTTPDDISVLKPRG